MKNIYQENYCCCYNSVPLLRVLSKCLTVVSQVQNLAIRSQQGASSASPSQAQLQALGLKQASGAMQNSLSVQPAAQMKNPSLGAPGLGGKGTTQESITEGGKKAEGASELALRGVAVSRNVTTVSSRALLTPGKPRVSYRRWSSMLHQWNLTSRGL